MDGTNRFCHFARAYLPPIRGLLQWLAETTTEGVRRLRLLI